MIDKVKAPGYRVLVRLKPLVKKETFEGSMIIRADITNSQHQREQEAITKAYVVDIGPTAWKAVDIGEPWCKVGDCVQISKYSGVLIDSDDGSIYRMVNDQDIQAVFPLDKEGDE